MLGQDRGDGQGGGGAADPHRPAGQDAEQSRFSPSMRAATAPKPMVRDHPHHHGDDGRQAQADDLADGDLGAEQGHADAQDGFGRDLDAGDAAAFLVQEVEGHADQKREQHDRRGVMLAQPGGGQGHRAGGDQAGTQMRMKTARTQASRRQRSAPRMAGGGGGCVRRLKPSMAS